MMYCDFNATAPMQEEVLLAVVEAMKFGWANSFSPHSLGRKASVMVEEARHAVANMVGAESRMIRFTSGATESNSWLLRAYQSRGVIYTSAVEHPSVLSYANKIIPTDSNGIICLDAMEQMITQEPPALVSVMAANNETGVIQPLEEISRLLIQYKIPFHCDATQIFSKIHMNLPADYITVSAHKFGGPKGVGALILKSEVKPLLLGGPQERSSRAGTHNVPAIVGMGVACGLVKAQEIQNRIVLETTIEELGGKILARDALRLPNTVCALFPYPGDLIVMALDLQNVQASTGSACSSGASKQSHVLRAMGEQGIPVRFSIGEGTDVDGVCRVLKNVISSIGDV